MPLDATRASLTMIDLQLLPMPGTHSRCYAPVAADVRAHVDEGERSAILVYDDAEPGGDDVLLMTVRWYFAPAPYVGPEAIYVWPVAKDLLGRYIAGSAVYTMIEDPTEAMIGGEL